MFQEDAITNILKQIDASKLMSINTHSGVKKFTEELSTVFFEDNELATCARRGNGKKKEKLDPLKVQAMKRMLMSPLILCHVE